MSVDLLEYTWESSQVQQEVRNITGLKYLMINCNFQLGSQSGTAFQQATRLIQ